MANEIATVDIPTRGETKWSTFSTQLKELPEGKALSVALNGETSVESLRMTLRSVARNAGVSVNTSVRGSSVIVWKK